MRVWISCILAALAFPAAGSAGTVFLLDGRGWGHGVGMSQWGAEGYARHGYAYRKILAHYYPHTSVVRTSPRPVRVLLLEGADAIRVGSAAPFVVVDARGKKLHLPARSVVLDRKLVLRHKKLAPPLRFRAGAQPLQVDFAAYRGDVVLKKKPDGLMAVNELPLDRYLRGVVPWEVPKGWHEAAYRAQAVAARSYTLATLHPGKDFDLFADTRSQMYGGVAAERPQTNLAVGSTAGEVLMWNGSIVPAFYFSTSGGKTSSVHDAWPKARQVPYLVSVADPYDYISPHHVWPTTILTAARIGAALHLRGVRDARIVRNSSGRAQAVRVLSAAGWTLVPGQTMRETFELGSTDFDLRAMTIDAPASRALFGSRVRITGWVRGLGKARLQVRTERGWKTAAHLRPAPTGRFAVTVRASRSTSYRIAYNSLAGDAVELAVTPRVAVRVDGTKLRALVSPRLPLQVQRLTHNEWRPIARTTGAFHRTLKPGSYRVKVLGGPEYTAVVSKPVGLRRAS